jgi:hypothetical protein
MRTQSTLRTLAVGAAALVFLVPAPSSAETRFGLALFAGYNSYAMDDVNDFIQNDLNAGLAGTGISMDEITSGLGFGEGVRVRPSDKLLIALDYERLAASSEISLFGSDLEMNTPADVISGTLFYYFPSTSRARFGVGIGAGYYNSGGAVEADSAGVGIEIDVEGSGIGFHGLAALDYGISSVVHVEGTAGYRLAESDEVEVGGVTQFNSDGEEATLNWSGFMSRVGLTFYFGAGAPAP